MDGTVVFLIIALKTENKYVNYEISLLILGYLSFLILNIISGLEMFISKDFRWVYKFREPEAKITRKGQIYFSVISLKP